MQWILTEEHQSVRKMEREREKGDVESGGISDKK